MRLSGLCVRTGLVAAGVLFSLCLPSTSLLAQCTLNGSPNTCVLTGPLTITSYSDAAGHVTTSTGTLTNNGTMGIVDALELTGNTALMGTGTLTLSSGQIGTNGNGFTLTNASNIVGSGVIGSNSATFQNLNLSNSGTINGNSGTLSIQGDGSSVLNSGTFEATSGGTLTLATQAAIGNSGGLILSSGTGSLVNVSTTIQGGILTTSSGGVLQTTGGATLDGSNSGALTLSDGSTYTAGAAASTTITKVTGMLNLGTVSGGTLALGGALELIGNTTLSLPGTGSVTMNGGQIGTNGNGFTLTNGGLIQGSGVIGSNATTFQNLNLTNNGTINANAASALSITGDGGTIVNSGTFEATGGSTLNVSTAAAVQNFGSIVSTGSGSTVNLTGTIQGGTLTTASGGVVQSLGTVTLDAANLGAITLSDNSTYTAGAGTLTNVQGQFNLGTVAGSTLSVTGTNTNPALLRLVNNTTVSGPGSVALNGGLIGTNGNGFTLTNNTLIQGTGVIGSNTGADFQNLSLNNAGTINANSSGNTLSIQGNGGSIVNSGTFEATGGGILYLATSSAINNQHGSIVAGTGSLVIVSNTTVQGGILTTQGSGTMGSFGTVTLDGASLGAITLSDNSTYMAAVGTLTNIQGQFNLGTVAGSTLSVTGTNTNTALLRLTGNTTLSGPGSVLLNNGLIGTNGNGFTLTNNSLIQGAGVIGSNVGADFQNVSLNNAGTINANSLGNTLSVQGNGGSIINTGLLEATAGTLNLATQAAITNSGGNITAAGSVSMVNVSTTIQGGTLNTSGGGVIQTVSSATLDGANSGAITISDGSTYTAGNGTITQVLGTLNLGTSTGGTLALSANMQLVGNTTLAGPGSLTLAGSAQIGTNGNGFTLTNNSTISGTGLVGSNLGSLYSNDNVTNGGTIVSSGGTLTLAGSGTLTNTGTLHAGAATTLVSTMSGLASSTYSSNTLSTGTYAADAGATLKINALGTTGGEIHNNAATVTLTGAGSAFVDGDSLDAISNFVNNMATGSFSILGGRNFNSSGAFTDAGTVDIGGTDLFSVNGGASSYTETAGITEVDGTLTAGSTLIDGGILEGTGTINNSVLVQTGGEVKPGDSPGTLTINGSYTQASTGSLLIQIGSANSFDVLDVMGAASLNGAVSFRALNGFQLAANEKFLFLDYNSLTGTFGTVNTSGLNLAQGLTAQVLYGQGNGDQAELVINGQTTATPEPSTWLMVLTGGLVLAGAVRFNARARRGAEKLR